MSLTERCWLLNSLERSQETTFELIPNHLYYQPAKATGGANIHPMGTGAGCLRTAAQSPGLWESPWLEMTACPKYYGYHFSCLSPIYRGFFFQHLSKPNIESTRGCVTFLSTNLFLQHSWVNQREQLTFWFPTQPATCNPNQKSTKLKLQTPTLISFSNLSPLCSSHIQNNQENFLTPLWQATWKQLPQYFFIIVFSAHSKADLKEKKAPQTRLT